MLFWRNNHGLLSMLKDAVKGFCRLWSLSVNNSFIRPSVGRNLFFCAFPFQYIRRIIDDVIYATLACKLIAV